MEKNIQDHIQPQQRTSHINRGDGIYFAIFLFLASTQYDHPYGIYPYPYLYLVLLLIGVGYIYLRRAKTHPKQLLVLIGLLTYAIGIQFTGEQIAFGEIGTLILAIVTAFVYATIVARLLPNEVSFALDLVLWLFSAALILQVIVNAFGFGYLDVHQIVFPWSQGKGSELSFGVPRYTGLHQEPGSHATVVTAFLLLSLYRSKSLRFIHIISLLSCALTFSTIGLVYFLGLSVVISSKFFKLSTSAISLIAGVLPTILYAVWKLGAQVYLQARFLERDSDMSLNERVGNYEFWLTWSDQDKFLGKGLASLRSIEFTSLQGSGFLFSSIVCFGMPWIILLFLSTITIQNRRPYILGLTLTIIFISISRFSPIFLMPYFMLFMAAKPKEAYSK